MKAIAMEAVGSSIGIFRLFSMVFLALGARGTNFWIWILVENDRVRATTRWWDRDYRLHPSYWSRTLLLPLANSSALSSGDLIRGNRMPFAVVVLLRTYEEGTDENQG